VPPPPNPKKGAAASSKTFKRVPPLLLPSPEVSNRALTTQKLNFYI